MTIITELIIWYVVSFIASWFTIRSAHKVVWKNISVSGMDIFVCVFPIMNTFIPLLLGPMILIEKFNFSFNSFFLLKKDK